MTAAEAADRELDAEAEIEDKTYKMTVELSVLESLGINLYSNAAAVLSELVANAYDADSGSVSITWQPQTDEAGEGTGLTEVVVSDDGSGMGVAELNGRFLKPATRSASARGHRRRFGNDLSWAERASGSCPSSRSLG